MNANKIIREENTENGFLVKILWNRYLQAWTRTNKLFILIAGYVSDRRHRTAQKIA